MRSPSISHAIPSHSNLRGQTSLNRKLTRVTRTYLNDTESIRSRKSKERNRHHILYILGCCVWQRPWATLENPCSQQSWKLCTTILVLVGNHVHIRALSPDCSLDLVLCGHSLGAGVAAILGLVGKFQLSLTTLKITYLRCGLTQLPV